jgi:hypothetical protein
MQPFPNSFDGWDSLMDGWDVLVVSWDASMLARMF